jgi:hypothetical protein
MPDLGDGTGLELEVLFLALDRPDDVKKLKSLELTGAWLNEASELEQAVLDMCYAARRPLPVEAPARRRQLDRRHHGHEPAGRRQLVVRAGREGREHGRQGAQLLAATKAAEEMLRESKGRCGADQPLFEFFKQPGGLVSR